MILLVLAMWDVSGPVQARRHQQRLAKAEARKLEASADEVGEFLKEEGRAALMLDALMVIGMTTLACIYLLIQWYRAHPIPWPKSYDLDDEPSLVPGLFQPRYCDACGNLLQNGICPMGHQ